MLPTLTNSYIPKDNSLQSETVHYKRGVCQQFCLPSHTVDPSEWAEEEVSSWLAEQTSRWDKAQGRFHTQTRRVWELLGTLAGITEPAQVLKGVLPFSLLMPSCPGKDTFNFLSQSSPLINLGYFKKAVPKGKTYRLEAFTSMRFLTERLVAFNSMDVGSWKRQPTPGCLPGKSQGQRSLVG